MRSSWRKTDHYRAEMLFFLELGDLRAAMKQILDYLDLKFEI